MLDTYLTCTGTGYQFRLGDTSLRYHDTGKPRFRVCSWTRKKCVKASRLADTMKIWIMVRTYTGHTVHEWSGFLQFWKPSSVLDMAASRDNSMRKKIFSPLSIENFMCEWHRNCGDIPISNVTWFGGTSISNGVLLNAFFLHVSPQKSYSPSLGLIPQSRQWFVA